jgi:hypothetical protein
MHKSATKCNETLGKWCKNKHGASKIIDTLETYQIWHAFFGMPGSCNNINVLQWSPLMTRLAMREGSSVEFEANGHKYNYGYFLADGVYPRWQTFVKPII